jgi:hypothetical protein
MRGPEPTAKLSEVDRDFVRLTLRRRRAYLTLAVVGFVAALALAVYLAVRRIGDPGYSLRGKIALVILILLNSRHNYRHYRSSKLLHALLPSEAGESGSS